MKGFGRKVAFGIPMIVLLVGSGILMLSSENPNELFVPIVFVFAFAGGIAFWIILNTRESKRRREESAKRKLR